MMKSTTIIIWTLTISLLLIISSAIVSYAQSNSNYELIWWTMDGGYGESSGDGYMLNSILGQSNVDILEGGGYILTGGFGTSTSSSKENIYIPLILRN